MINLTPHKEKPKPIQIAQELIPKEETLLIQTLVEYKDVFS